jgi:hypothetical protein
MSNVGATKEIKLNEQDIIEKLSQIDGNSSVSKSYSSSTFELNRNFKTIKFKILDFGESDPGNRYQCEVESENGNKTCGNLNSHISLAIGDIRWELLN